MARSLVVATQISPAPMKTGASAGMAARVNVVPADNRRPLAASAAQAARTAARLRRLGAVRARTTPPSTLKRPPLRSLPAISTPVRPSFAPRFRPRQRGYLAGRYSCGHRTQEVLGPFGLGQMALTAPRCRYECTDLSWDYWSSGEGPDGEHRGRNGYRPDGVLGGTTRTGWRRRHRLPVPASALAGVNSGSQKGPAQRRWNRA